MWDSLPLPPKPFYRRAWFLAPVMLVGIAAVIAGIVGWAELEKWERRAQHFDYAKLDQMESASIIYDRSGQVIGRLFVQNRDEVSLDQLSPNLLKAVIGAEDARFYKHQGVDYFGIVRAVVRNLQSKRTRQGASTITQQLARNTFPTELPPNDRSYGRKMLEIAVAKEVEKRLGDKQKILELYLNRVFFGAGFYGVESAARGYFGKHAKELTLSESAMLTGLLKSPNRLSPWRNRQACIEQRDYVLQRLLETKAITREEHDAALAQDLVIKNRRPIHQESYAAGLVAQQVDKIVTYEKAVSEGYRIYTTIDGDLQKKAESALREQIETVERRPGYEHQSYAQFDQIARAWRRKYQEGDPEAGPQPEPEYLQGAVVALDNATGGILALVGGRDFTHSVYDRALMARRPAGTAFKPIVYAAAFEHGLFPGTPVQDAVIDNRQVMIGGTTGILGEWGPERMDNKYEGVISARTALVKSKNAASVRLGMMIGRNLSESLDRVADLAKSAGIESPLRPFPATFLGSSEVTPMEMTLANTIFATGGVRPQQPFIIDRIEEKSGAVIYRAKLEKERVIKPTTAFEIHTCLADALERGTAEKAFSEHGLKRYPLGGKTGTAYNFTDVWFLGYSSEVTCGVWAGFDKPRTTIYRGAFSHEIAMPIWANVMKATFANYKPKEFVAPKGIIKCEVCSASGLLATEKCFDVSENKETGEKVRRQTTYHEIATDAQAPKVGCDVHGPPTDRALTQTSLPAGSTPVAGIGGMEVRRAALAVDITAHTPITLKGPTVLGNDPYNSMQAVASFAAMQGLDGKVAPVESTTQAPGPTPDGPEIEVRRAEAVKPMELEALIDSAIKLEPPKPLEF